MKVRVETFVTIRKAFERYKSEVEASGLAPSTKASYIEHAEQFVRWIKDAFRAWGRLERTNVTIENTGIWAGEEYQST